MPEIEATSVQRSHKSGIPMLLLRTAGIISCVLWLMGDFLGITASIDESSGFMHLHRTNMYFVLASTTYFYLFVETMLALKSRGYIVGLTVFFILGMFDLWSGHYEPHPMLPAIRLLWIAGAVVLVIVAVLNAKQSEQRRQSLDT